MKSVRIGRLAQREINRALTRSQARYPAKTGVFRQVIRTTLDAIGANPRIGSLVSPAGDRQVILPQRFPYSVIYQEFPMFIQVIAFPHHRQRPRYWSRRLNRP